MGADIVKKNSKKFLISDISECSYHILVTEMEERISYILTIFFPNIKTLIKTPTTFCLIN